MFRPSATRTAKLRSAAQAWRTAGRRTYASDHGPAKKSSDLFWFVYPPGYMRRAAIAYMHVDCKN